MLLVGTMCFVWAPRVPKAGLAIATCVWVGFGWFYVLIVSTSIA